MISDNHSYLLVVGLGVSGIAMARFLRSKGMNVVATDCDPSKKDIEPELNELGIRTRIGFHDHETFNRAQALIPGPGIALDNRFIKEAVKQKIPVTGELDIFFRYNKVPVIAVTGTNGKTTTTSLAGTLLKACGFNPFIGGNIGTPLVNSLMSRENHDIIVAEVSSFQLDLASQFRPDIGVLLNISQDHLDRYENFAEYEKSKTSLLKRQKKTDTAVINASIRGCGTLAAGLESKIFTFSCQPSGSGITPDAKIDDNGIEICLKNKKYRLGPKAFPGLKGTHNLENAAAAILACLAAGANMDGIKKGLRSFTPPAHRMQFIKKIRGISFYNDSKATNIDAVKRAMESLGQNLILIMGGRNKDNDLGLIRNEMKKRAKAVIAIGECRQEIKTIFEDICPVIEAGTMEDAVNKAFTHAAEKDIVLLSPACASFDMYDNYKERGNDFVKCVNRLGERVQ
jgi:UDP-N-acetylmuramoylalanine--D-glutamate ligase